MAQQMRKTSVANESFIVLEQIGVKGAIMILQEIVKNAKQGIRMNTHMFLSAETHRH